MKVAFVVQRCGREVVGGAELHCLQIAQRMSEHWDTEVLTTCALEYTRWDNHYPPGPEEIDGTVVRRFRVDQPRDPQKFDRLSGELRLSVGHSSLKEEERWMRAQGPISTGLLDFIASHKHDYDAFIFFGYLYATSYFGLPLVQEKAFLAPLAHDEWPIYLGMWNRFFSLPRALIFNTSAERQFLRQRFRHLPLEGPVIGVGIEAPANPDPAAFRERYNIDDPFLLYVGRVDAAKGCAMMFEHFQSARAAGMLKHKLVLIGREVMPVPFDDDIIHLGFLSDDEKWNALAACDWLLMPSPNESLSIALLEAWSVGRPVVVNAACDVLVEHCRLAHGGLWHESFEEWAAALSLTSAPVADALGAQGRQYVQRNYAWARVEQDYLALLGSAKG